MIPKPRMHECSGIRLFGESARLRTSLRRAPTSWKMGRMLFARTVTIVWALLLGLQFSGFSVAQIQNASPPPDGQKPPHKLVEISGVVKNHTYKSDKNGLIQFGAPPVGLVGAGILGMTTKLRPYLGGDLGGVNQLIVSSNLPASVVSEGATRDISLSNTSLRLQDEWCLRVAVYPIGALRLGYQFSNDSWRYERLNNASMTTIPYIKSIEESHAIFAGYTQDIARLELSGEGGVGKASLRFLNGVEAYLQDNDGTNITSLPGRIIPLSARLGYPIRSGDKSICALPFIRYEYAATQAGGTHIINRSLSVGLSITWEWVAQVSP